MGGDTMTDPTIKSDKGWWPRNRIALLALVPLAALALAASSYQYRTYYQPNAFTHVTTASGKSLDYREEFTAKRKPYSRAARLTLVSLEAKPLGVNASGPTGARADLWTVELQFAAKPDVPLEGCTLVLIDRQGQVYSEVGRDLMPKLEGAPSECVPVDAPGPSFDFLGDLTTPQGAARPPSWPVRGQFVLPHGQKPAFVRVSWKTPYAALIPVD